MSFSLRRIPFLILFLTVVSCSSIEMTQDQNMKPDVEPTFEESFSFYFLGLKGSYHLNVQKICHQRQPYYMETLMTAEDTLLSLVTLGIYTPLTVKIWCDQHGT